MSGRVGSREQLLAAKRNQEPCWVEKLASGVAASNVNAASHLELVLQWMCNTLSEFGGTWTKETWQLESPKLGVCIRGCVPRLVKKRERFGSVPTVMTLPCLLLVSWTCVLVQSAPQGIPNVTVVLCFEIQSYAWISHRTELIR